MNRTILHVDIPADMLTDIDTIAELMRVNRSQIVRWMLSDGLDEYKARLRQSAEEARKDNGGEKPVAGRNNSF